MKRIRPHDPGLKIFHDIRNERFPLAAVKPLSTDFVPRSMHHRQYRTYDQGQTPRCTGYGMATLCAAQHEFNVPPISADEWYERNQAHDRAEGRTYSEGATVVAALETGRDLGIWPAYRWLYTIAEMQQAILAKPIVLGTNWYESMWTRDEFGNVTEPGDNDEPVGGHLFIVNAYRLVSSVRTASGVQVQGRWRYPSTWGDGDYWISDRLMHRLLRESGEAAQADEIRLPKERAA